jgi:tRNA (cytidine32/uridine32-2'-O)-methyltransferase
MKLQNIRIVLVGTSHPGNIGAAARAMHNMGINRLSLVDPQCPVGEVAYARASGANIVLDQRETFAELPAAIADCNLVIAATARRRSLAWPEIEPRTMVDKILQLDDNCQVALVFGREHSGLNNEEIQLCNEMVCIPTNPDFSSLNLAAAVQVLCYEIYSGQFVSPEPGPPVEQDLPASSQEIEDFFEHLQQSIEHSGFLNARHPGLTMARLRRLYLRIELMRSEVNILRGILSSFHKLKK